MAGGNSNVKLQEICDDAGTLGDISPVLATGGRSNGPAISIANDIMLQIINGGPIGQPYNWKWNRFNVTPFPTISYQQDYLSLDVLNLGWLESAWAVNINQTSVPKQKQQLEVKKDLEVTYDQSGYPGKICWLPNDQLIVGTWGNAPIGPTADDLTGQTNVIGPNLTGLQNPGPNVIYTNPVGLLQAPINATTCIKDVEYGNLWLLTTYGTCGATVPAFPSNPTYPTLLNPSLSPTRITDGSCVWTAVNPKGQGFRLNPVPPQSGTVWMIQPVGQMKAPRFTSLNQTLEPIPDDFSLYFKNGFFAECFRRSPDPKVRAKYQMERQLFLESLDKAVRQADREMDDVGFYPGESIMDSGCGLNPITPAYPFGAWSGQ